MSCSLVLYTSTGLLDILLGTPNALLQTVNIVSVSGQSVLGLTSRYNILVFPHHLMSWSPRLEINEEDYGTRNQFLVLL